MRIGKNKKACRTYVSVRSVVAARGPASQLSSMYSSLRVNEPSINMGG